MLKLAQQIQFKSGMVCNSNVQSRSMATLKDSKFLAANTNMQYKCRIVRYRIRTISNIQKITKSMKMVSAAKYNRCERELRAVKGLEDTLKDFSDNFKLEDSTNAPKRLLIAVSSDRGLCGGIHSSIIKHVKQNVIGGGCSSEDTKVVAIGDKIKAGLQSHILSDVSKVNITPNDAFHICEVINATGFQYDVAEIIYNRFVSVISYETTVKKVYSDNVLKAMKDIYDFDDLTDESLKSVVDFHLASALFYSLRQSAASEQSSRMSAMENATKNADEMLQKLSLLFNRTRQSMITRELIEIISGASSLESDKK